MASKNNIDLSNFDFGFSVVDEEDVVIIGHTRLMASKELGLKKVPVLKRKLKGHVQ